MWGRYLDDERDRLREATDSFLDSGDELPLLNALISTLEIVARDLAPLMQLKRPHGKVTVTFDDETPSYCIDLGPAPVDSAPRDQHWTPDWQNLPLDGAEIGEMNREANSAVRNAVRLLYRDRRSTATKIVIGNGAAPRDVTSDRIMTEMHPRRMEPLVLPEVTGPQLQISAEECYKSLKLDAGLKDAPAGVFGLTPAMHYHQRGRPMKQTLMWELARIQSLLANAKLGRAFFFLMTTGSLSALNKLDTDGQRQRETEGLDRKLRPVNSGCSIIKTSLKCAAATKSGRDAVASTRPIQCGQGTPAGPESVVHLARSRYEAGKPVGSEDVQNAFNKRKRLSMLAACKARWPSSTALLN